MGCSPAIRVPVTMHGAFGNGWRPSLIRVFLHVLYQCWGLHLRS